MDSVLWLLAKPDIRKAAIIGDWVVGTGSKVKDRAGRIVYAMHVTEAMIFDAYWDDPRFLIKRPNLRGSWKQAYGDKHLLPGRAHE